MSFFQQTVLHKHLKALDAGAVKTAFETYRAYFHNPVVQQNIRDAKEEQFQEGFLRALFEQVLGYTLYPSPNYNITTEYKNVKDNKKADGAILIEGTVRAVIELKGTDTTDLGRIEAQAFGYKVNQPDCLYVITSNFEKLRFYVDNAIEHLEFNLFTLSEKAFELLWLCLALPHIAANLPKQLKAESVSREDAITQNLYNDYSRFKHALHQNLVALNPAHDPLLLFRKSQKLLDRFLFLFFAEDRQLLPPNSVRLILDDWRALQERDVDVTLYERFKKYFGYLNTGFKGKRYDVFAYNGGLFKPDELLDGLAMDDELLYAHCLKLSDYDFVSEVDVNILGHIFENSLNELDEIKASIEGQPVERSKRKKDGVFYTPKYITKYMVEQTVGRLCAEKKNAMGLGEDAFAVEAGRPRKAVQPLFEKLSTYREWLLQLSICDPACGSGAFLNQALDFLIAEHRHLDELQARLFGDALVLSDFDKAILENNLFGVDINEESVEIAKLSLWLRTAQPNRKLNDLNNNIKCGNSLIGDPALAGEKAFNWQAEFPEVFAKGGFDVVLGNPPYVQLQSMGEMSDTLAACGFETYDKGADLYCLFTERGYTLLKAGGVQSFIMPNKWMLVKYGKPLRKFLSQTGMRQMLNFGDIQFFQDATTIVCIFVTQKGLPAEMIEVLSLNQKTYSGDFPTELESKIYSYPAIEFGENEWIIKSLDDARKLDRMKTLGIALKELPVNINYGIKTGFNEAFYIDETTRQKLITADPKSAEIIQPMVRGRDIAPYTHTDFEYLIGTFPSLKLDIDQFPAIRDHLLLFGYDRLKQTGDPGARKKTSGNWFETQDSIGYYREFAKPKIIYPNMTSVFPFMYDESGLLSNDKSFILTAQDDRVSLLFLTAVFNSSLAKLWIWYNCPELQGGTREIRKVYFEHFPVPVADPAQTAALENLAAERIRLTAAHKQAVHKFHRSLQRNLGLEALSTQLQNWYQLDYKTFVAELKKKKVKLSLSEQAEWEDYFQQEFAKVLGLGSEIEKTDRSIDHLVHALYGVGES